MRGSKSLKLETSVRVSKKTGDILRLLMAKLAIFAQKCIWIPSTTVFWLNFQEFNICLYNYWGYHYYHVFLLHFLSWRRQQILFFLPISIGFLEKWESWFGWLNIHIFYSLFYSYVVNLSTSLKGRANSRKTMSGIELMVPLYIRYITM